MPETWTTSSLTQKAFLKHRKEEHLDPKMPFCTNWHHFWLRNTNTLESPLEPLWNRRRAPERQYPAKEWSSDQRANHKQPTKQATSNPPTTNQQPTSNLPATNQQPASNQPSTNQQPANIETHSHLNKLAHLRKQQHVCQFTNLLAGEGFCWICVLIGRYNVWS